MSTPSEGRVRCRPKSNDRLYHVRGYTATGCGWPIPISSSRSKRFHVTARSEVRRRQIDPRRQDVGATSRAPPTPVITNNRRPLGNFVKAGVAIKKIASTQAKASNPTSSPASPSSLAAPGDGAKNILTAGRFKHIHHFICRSRSSMMSGDLDNSAAAPGRRTAPLATTCTPGPNTLRTSVVRRHRR